MSKQVRTEEFYLKKNPYRQRKLVRATQADVDFIRRNFRLGPIEIQLKLPHLTYNQVRYTMGFYNLQGYSQYCRRCRRT